jgi:Protein of unknown function (DUF2809)
MRFSSYYFFGFVLLFLTELYIAIYMHDDFIRPYVGDALVVILLYTIVRAFLKVGILPTAIGVLIFSFGVEILQYFKIVEILGLGSSAIARTVIGTTFSWEDLICYSIGVVMVLWFEKFLGTHKREWHSVR